MNVYKYRGGSPEILDRDLNSIVDNYFWAPTANQLNDPSEAYLNDEEIFSLLKSIGANEVEQSLASLLKMRHSVGVYSLSKTPLDELMWAYYGGSHTGFCIEYDLDRLVLEARASWNVIDVVYHPTPQTVIFDDVINANGELPVLEKMIATKSNRWSHEKEIRIVTTSSGKNYYAPPAINGIYFGCRADDSFILKVRQKLSGRDLKYYQMDFSKNSYSMNFKELQYDSDIDGVRTENLAPVDDGAIPDLKYIKEENKPFYEYLEKAVLRVRRDPSCEKVVYTDFSVDKSHEGKPQIYVQYESNVPTPYYNILKQYFTIQELESI